MKQIIKKIIAPLLITLAVFGIGAGIGLVSMGQTASAQLKEAACEGAALGGTNTTCSDTPGDPNGASARINRTIAIIINVLSFVVGIAAVIMLIIGGFRYVTSGGDSNSVSGAKNTILYAIIGLVVVGLSQLIVQFVLGKL